MECYSPKQAAEKLSCSTEHVRQLILTGKIDYMEKGDGKIRKHYVIPDYSLEEYIKNNTTSGSSKSPSKTSKKPEKNAKPDAGELAARERRRKRKAKKKKERLS